MRFPIKISQILLLLLLALFAMPVAAQEPVTDDEVNEVAKDLYCPVCENTPVDACGTQACEDWRQEIRQQLSQGRSEEEIHEYFAARYGSRVLAEPPRQEYATLWLLPVVAVIVGALLLGLYLRNLKNSAKPNDDTINVAQSTAVEPPPAADDDDYVSRIEKEVREE